MDFPLWLYSKDKKGMIIRSVEDIEKNPEYCYDTPDIENAKQVTGEDFPVVIDDVTPAIKMSEEEAEGNQAGSKDEDLKVYSDQKTGAPIVGLDVHVMKEWDRPQIKKYALEKFGVKIDARKPKEIMLKELKQKVG